jgi:hypothetical protein
MSDGESLQFERAEFEQAPAAAQCAECNRTLTGSYYEVNGQTVCEACRYTIESRLNTGSSAGRFFKAAGAGLAAAIAGAVLYYAISALTGYEFGLIAIVVGFGVGAAVRWGSNNRGGWRYQTLAIVLTYLAIVSTYIPPIIEGLRTMSTATAEAQVAPGDAEKPQEGAAAVTPAAVSSPGDTQQADTPPTFRDFALSLLALLAIACVAPFFAGFQNIIGIVIIGIGLYEAWKLNRRTEITITGPHMLGRPPQAAAAV